MYTEKFVSALWTDVGNLLRKTTLRAGDRGAVVLSFLTLKRIDALCELGSSQLGKADSRSLAEIADKRGISFFKTSDFSYEQLRSDTLGGQDSIDRFLACLSRFAQEVLEDLGFGRAVKMLKQANMLAPVLDRFARVDVSPNSISNETYGDVIETVLARMSAENPYPVEHYTSRDTLRLITRLVMEPDIERILESDSCISLYDPCCGTGGVFISAKEWFRGQGGDESRLQFYGQELNQNTRAICLANLQFDENQSQNIALGSTLTEDCFRDRSFDYVLSVPPFGVRWDSESDKIAEDARQENTRFAGGLPRQSDSQLLFVQHALSKADPDNGSRMGLITNGSPLEIGAVGSGESEIRRWIIENDFLDCVVRLPDSALLNTSFQSYLWILTNRKPPSKSSKIQFVDASRFGSEMRQSMGMKSRYLSGASAEEILRIYLSEVPSRYSKVLDGSDLGYQKVQVAIGADTDRGDISHLQDTIVNEHIPLSFSVEQYLKDEVEPFIGGLPFEIKNQGVGYAIHASHVFAMEDDIQDDLPKTDWMKLKYVGQFGKEVDENTIGIRVHKVTEKSPVAKVYSEEEITSGKALKDKAWYPFRVFSPDYDGDMIVAYLNSRYGKDIFGGLYRGVAQQRVRKDELLDVKVPRIDKRAIEVYKYNKDLLERIQEEIEVIKDQVLFQFDIKQMDSLAERVRLIYESTTDLLAEDLIRHLLLAGESLTSEFKETFFTNARNKYQKDKEIEKSALKTLCGFLNRDGGKLLVGVDDAGKVLGIERDTFRSADSYLLKIKDTIKVHLGVEALRCINYDLHVIEGHKVLLVECTPSKHPVYYDKEIFYVRVNPATEELKGKALVDYVNEHFRSRESALSNE